MPGGTISRQNSLNGVAEYYLWGGITDPTVVAHPGCVGAYYIRVGRKVTDPIALYRKLDNGTTTNWELLTLKIVFNGQTVDTLTINHTGTGVTVTEGPPGTFDVNIPGLITEDEGVQVNDPTLNIDFVGAGVVASDGGAGKTVVTIPGGPSTNFANKFFRKSANETLDESNASRDVFENIPVQGLSSGGTPKISGNECVPGYINGEDLELNIYYISDVATGGGSNQNVATQVDVYFYKEGDDTGAITPHSIIDDFAMPAVVGEVEKRVYNVTAADLGNPVSGDYVITIRISRFPNDPFDRFNKNLNFAALLGEWI